MIRVTVVDTENGDTETHDLSPHGYIVVCSGRAYVDSEQTYGNGTRVVTVKRGDDPAVCACPGGAAFEGPQADCNGAWRGEAVIPINPEAIGDPNATPVVYLGEEAGKVLGIPTRQPGLFRKFRVERLDGRDRPGGDKADARYFVLDYAHDQYARRALAAYADACERELPTLARDLRIIAAQNDPPALSTDRPDQPEG